METVSILTDQSKVNRNICHLWVYQLSKSHHLGPVQLQTVPWDWSSGHEILLRPPPPPPPFQHRWDCSLIFSQPAPGMPGKVNTTSPSGNPWGGVWLLTLNPLWSGCLLSKNRRHLGNTHRERCMLPDTYSYRKIISGTESLLTFIPKIWYVSVLPTEFHLQNFIFQFFQVLPLTNLPWSIPATRRLLQKFSSFSFSTENLQQLDYKNSCLHF